VPEKRESEGKRHLVEQQKGQRRGWNRKWEKGRGVADVTFLFSGRQAWNGSTGKDIPAKLC